jgi:hypothetical protein
MKSITAVAEEELLPDSVAATGPENIRVRARTANRRISRPNGFIVHLLWKLFNTT